MGDSWTGRVGELKSWLKETAQKAEGEIDTDAIMARVRDVVGSVDKNIDTDAIVARAKEAFTQVEGKVDTEKLKQWVEEVDAEKVKGWIAEARTKAGLNADDV